MAKLRSFFDFVINICFHGAENILVLHKIPAFNVDCCIYYTDGTFAKSFVNFI